MKWLKDAVQSAVKSAVARTSPAELSEILPASKANPQNAMKGAAAVSVAAVPRRDRGEEMRRRVDAAMSAESSPGRQFAAHPLGGGGRGNIPAGRKRGPLGQAAAESMAAETTPGGVVVRTLEAGGGLFPTAASEVEVHYEGRLADGTVFDSSYDRGEATSFPLRNVIRGWQEGLQVMQEGATAILTIPPELGYGSRGAPPTIPGGATLMFKVELVKVLSGGVNGLAAASTAAVPRRDEEVTSRPLEASAGPAPDEHDAVDDALRHIETTAGTTPVASSVEPPPWAAQMMDDSPVPEMDPKLLAAMVELGPLNKTIVARNDGYMPTSPNMDEVVESAHIIRFERDMDRHILRPTGEGGFSNPNASVNGVELLSSSFGAQRKRALPQAREAPKEEERDREWRNSIAGQERLSEAQVEALFNTHRDDSPGAAALAAAFGVDVETAQALLVAHAAPHFRTDKHGVTRGTWEKREGFAGNV